LGGGGDGEREEDGWRERERRARGFVFVRVEKTQRKLEVERTKENQCGGAVLTKKNRRNAWEVENGTILFFLSSRD
jgi:hypothetical protein